ncbi:Nucleolar MIF4G domain-containing protein 1 -like protein [Halotydeus destructor]|nr:Nucleolar MIF4G domain-containing protein 1 -like protein [Halotydeus destructor]
MKEKKKGLSGMVTKLSMRKAERKKQRKEKKQRKATHYGGKSSVVVDDDPVAKSAQLKELEAEKRKRKAEEQKKRAEVNKKKRAIEDSQAAILNEDKVIKEMEKKLRLNKRKNKSTVPKSFHDEGLGDVLDFIDNRNFDEDEEWEAKRSKKAKVSGDDKKGEVVENPFSDDEMDEDDFDQEFGGGDSDSQDEENIDEVDEEEDDEDFSGDEDNYSGSDSERPKAPKKVSKKPKTSMDIYGRERDAKGNLVESQSTTVKQSDSKQQKEDVSPELLRRIRGQLNRLASTNLPGISTYLEGLYKTTSFHQMNEGICQCIRDLIVIDGTLSPLKLISEMTMLLGSLHENIGEEVGGHANHYFLNLFDSLMKEPDRSESKKIDNTVAILCYSNAIGLIDPQLMFDVIDELVNVFDEKCIELLVFILIAVGFILRKQDAVRMKKLVTDVQKRAASIDKADIVGGKRVELMIEMITAIKNNNLLKVTSKSSGVVSPIDKDELRTVLNNSLKRSSKVKYIPGRYKQVLMSNRWWIKVGTLLELMEEDKKEERTIRNNDVELELDDLDEKLCRALRLNTTPLRKTLFKALITSSDYVEACERMSRIGKKMFAEVANVIIHVALHEKSFNMFYVHLLKSLSGVDRKYKLAIQFAVRDKIAEVATLKEKQRTSLESLVYALIKENVTSVNTLKVIEFSELDEIKVEFLKSIIGKIMEEPEDVMKDIFSKVPKKDNFASALKLFISCFMDESLTDKSKGMIRARLRMKQEV